MQRIFKLKHTAFGWSHDEAFRSNSDLVDMQI